MSECPACEDGYICRGAPGCIVKETFAAPKILCARVSWPVPATRYGNLWRCSWCGARVKVIA